MAAEQRPTPLSGCVMAFQEADRIADCVRSLQFCDEVLVVDSGSTDATRELAASLGARVVVHAPFPGMREQRQYCIDHARHDWVLLLDADERITAALQARIRALAGQGLTGAAYEMPRRNHYLGRVCRAGLFWPDRKVRLVDRRQCRAGGTNPHERIDVAPGGVVTRLDEPIEHLSYRDLRHHLRTIDGYSRTAAAALAAGGRRANPFDLLVRPPSVFVKSLLVKRGFLDGWRGFVIAALAAYTDWLKYWRLWRLPRRSTP